MGLDNLYVPAAILLSSFLGSWHCAGMCGPFAALTGAKGQLWHYHLGRLIIYSLLGALSGAFGNFVLSPALHQIRFFGIIALATILVVMGLQILFGQPGRAPWGLGHTQVGIMFQKVYRRISRFPLARSSFSLGLMAGLLPCMWLYTFVFAAASSQSPWSGGLLMFLFWLGGLPALSALPMMIRPALKTASHRKQKWSGAILIAAGVYALASHVMSSTM